MNLLQDLNVPQKRAVSHDKGPLLVLAGPGSGKTRVITHRIAYMISQGVPGDHILALTFTNKAAQEMARRVDSLLQKQCGVWISTFHSFCARILRRECHALGYASEFSIYDADDQKKAVTQVMESLNIGDIIKPAEIAASISKYKNACVTVDKLPKTPNRWEQTIARVYAGYQELLRKNNAFDFDDLLLKTLELFVHYKQVLEQYQDKFLYILIDEFQDTNMPQYEIAKCLAEKNRNICATGDPDQSIYSWRGANIGNILAFEKDFPNTTVIKLEQNYRSTKSILKAASEVIAHNRLRKEKKLWTENPAGEPLRLIEALDEIEMAEKVYRDIVKLKQNGVSLQDIAIFYRINAQSRTIETTLRNRNIPYEIVGGIEFYERAEVKDVLAYLRILVNPKDDFSTLRIINVPSRGLGKKALSTISEEAEKKNIPIFQAIQDQSIVAQLSPRSRNSLSSFVSLVENIKRTKYPKLVELVQDMLKKTGYMDYVKKKDVKKDEDREANVLEFVASVQEYEDQFGDANLVGFLERTSLLASIDRWKTTQEEERVTLMTLHSAKGLEFPIVYIIGVSEGLLPHHRSYEDEGEMEEERRLFFVGMTRAKQLLTLGYSRLSSQNRYNMDNRPSRFLEEIPDDSIVTISKAFGSSNRFSFQPPPFYRR